MGNELTGGSKGQSILFNKNANTSLTPAEKKNNFFAALKSTHEQAVTIAEFNKKPFLIYLIVDLTSSRVNTREKMQVYERQLATMVLGIGGSHPVVCKGVYHRGGQSSEAQILDSPKAIEDFFAIAPESGLTDIDAGLIQYLEDKTDAVASLGILIGDSIDGDETDTLFEIAEKLGTAKRPLVIAHELVTRDELEKIVAPGMAERSKGIQFRLSTYPEELKQLLENMRKVMSLDLNSLRKATSGTLNLGLTGSSDTKRLANDMAKTLLLSAPKP